MRSKTTTRRVPVTLAPGLLLGALITLPPGPSSAADSPTAWPMWSTNSIPSTSMAPNVNRGDIVSTLTHKGVCRGVRPKIGEVVIHKKTDSETLYIRRVVAGPGDTVQMRKGALVINGRPVTMRYVGPFELKRATSTPNPEWTYARLLQETLPNGASYQIVDLEPGRFMNAPLDDTAPVKLLSDMWFLMGDNRHNAADSRIDGPVPTSMICGVVDRIVWSWSLDRIGARP